MGIREANREVRERMTPWRRRLQQLVHALLVVVSLLLWALPFLPFFLPPPP